MKSTDYLKAGFAALGIMAINVAIAFGVVAAYAYLVAPGRDAAFYEAAAQEIAPWSSVVFGAPLFYVFARLLSQRRPERSPVGFALVMFAVYAAIDLAALIAAGAFPDFAAVTAISLTTKLAGAYLGAQAGRR